MTRPATIVIADWLANCSVGQWTPFEAATALKEALRKEGYSITGEPAAVTEIDRLRTCITAAMGCLDAESADPDERLAWKRLMDALEGRAPNE